jgi:hypothetical protein
MEDKEKLLMCLRVDHASPRAVVEGSIKSNCRECESLVWISVSGQQILAEGDVHIICDLCFGGINKPENDVQIMIRQEVIVETLAHILRDAETQGTEPLALYNFLKVMTGLPVKDENDA